MFYSFSGTDEVSPAACISLTVLKVCCLQNLNVLAHQFKTFMLCYTALLKSLVRSWSEEVLYHKHVSYNCYPYQSVLRSLSLSNESLLMPVLACEDDESLASGLANGLYGYGSSV